MSCFFENNDVVLFQGDSVTDGNRDRSDPQSLGQAYPAAVKAVYNTLFPGNGVRFVNRGVIGDRLRDLLARYETDIYEIQPSFLSVLIGINDVWRAFSSNDPCPLERFRREYTELLHKVKADFPAIKIMILEPFLLPADAEERHWQDDLVPKQVFIREFAEQYADCYLPLQKIMDDAVSRKSFSCAELAEDGIHPSYTGHTIIAAEYLKTLDII